jgi:hypothetical protein
MTPLHQATRTVPIVFTQTPDPGRSWLRGESSAAGRQRHRICTVRIRHQREDPQHRITFHFTPKHASWLNQIEIWFSILARKLLRRGNFASKSALRRKIEQFIAYFNETMAKPFRWTMEAKPLTG